MTFPLELNVRPMLEMMATPAAHKRLIVYATDHFIPPDEFLKESLAWLDRYPGPVRSRLNGIDLQRPSHSKKFLTLSQTMLLLASNLSSWVLRERITRNWSSTRKFFSTTYPSPS